MNKLISARVSYFDNTDLFINLPDRFLGAEEAASATSVTEMGKD